MSLESVIHALATEIGANIKATAAALQSALAGKADKTQVVYGSNGLEGGGQLNGSDVVITLADGAFGTWHLRPDIFGSSAGSVAQGNDPRLSDARTPTAHGHAQADVTGLPADLAAKAPLASPALTGNPTAPTQTAGTNNTRVATTAYADTAANAKVADAINDGITTVAPSQNAVFDALALKVNSYTGQTITVFVGTQSEYDALSSGVKNAAGFVGLIKAS